MIRYKKYKEEFRKKYHFTLDTAGYVRVLEDFLKCSEEPEELRRAKIRFFLEIVKDVYDCIKHSALDNIIRYTLKALDSPKLSTLDKNTKWTRDFGTAFFIKGGYSRPRKIIIKHDRNQQNV